MIQRKQTLFLLAATLVHLLLVFIPVVSWSDLQGHSQSTALLLPSNEIPTTIYFKIAVVLNAILLLSGFTAIFLYRRRNTQKLQSLLLSGVNAVLVVVLLFLPLLHPETVNAQKNWIIYLPALNSILCFMAARFIQKDIDLLKSADRIR
ncbi:MAG: DUF4293 family protein [Sediminibacterium sp.]|nr:DUF4293 family protein [Sediminibacterium sp.]